MPPTPRDRIAERLCEDLVGPYSEHEVVRDRPTQRYSTGILYPQESRIRPEEDEDGGLFANQLDEASGETESGSVSLSMTFKPSTAGLSFAIEPDDGGTHPIIELQVQGATYERFAVDADENEVPGEPVDRNRERWRRKPVTAVRQIELTTGETSISLAPAGIGGLEIYVLVTPHREFLTVTAALTNQLFRSAQQVDNEARHFFQVQLGVSVVAHGQLVPRHWHRPESTEDGKSAALIYRDVVEYAVGHTCSARPKFSPDGSVSAVVTDWIPRVIVPTVSDRGDRVFDRLRSDPNARPLEASWLCSSNATELITGLGRLVESYREWIAQEEARLDQLPPDLREQGGRHIGRCSLGADRMARGIRILQDQATVRRAFQLAQEAMATQFRWGTDGKELIWRPFQLGFQLLVLESLAEGASVDREVMDLLWFPTGGGKTEAYLFLTAFIILLRRLRQGDRGAGVAVIMRYTLRLLTIQQFQRAAAMIAACEWLRRRGEKGIGGLPRLGQTPIGIGLWVGAAATPQTVKDAQKDVQVTMGQRRIGSPTAAQLRACPCCHSELSWTVPKAGAVVECKSAPERCELAATGARLPIWTIDEEIYQACPSLVIGTVDKFAQIVRRVDSGALFGRRRDEYDPPELIIQDELHLISGPLGSMAGLYEVAIDEFCRKGAVRPKVIGSTATIRRAEDQIKGLFDRATYQFPAPGLDASNSGFSVVDREAPGRLYVGVTTSGRSATYMLQAITGSLLQSGEMNVSSQERDYYWSLVIYFNSLRELGRALVLMQDDVPVSVGQLADRRQEPPRRMEVPAELTSRIPSSEIRGMLARLNTSVGDPQAIDLLLASNMMSVGMDIPRLGMMLVNAQPKSRSEYIQATSRVGRGVVPGIVVTMYNATRARDRSHYETFHTWHSALYRDVEATSVTPFAPRAQDKALHAVLVALVRHLVPGMAERPKLDMATTAEREKMVTAIVSRAEHVDPSEASAVRAKLTELLEEWASHPEVAKYWDDYGRARSLLMSAEQFAAIVAGDGDLRADGSSGALWPTPNSMREVEPGTPFVLRKALTVQEAENEEPVG